MLPGKSTETGVATLPDEGLHGATVATSTATGTHGRTFDNITLPSQEGENTATELAGGVGRLPGSNTEERVAVLPDERSRGVHGSTPAAFGTHSPLNIASHSHHNNTTLPSQDDNYRGDGHQVTKSAVIAGGVGALPGLKDEPGVAVLPDERYPTQPSGLDKTIGEDAAMADAARAAGAHSAASPDAPKTKESEKQAGKVGAAAIGAKVGEEQMKKHEEKSAQNIHHDKPSQVSSGHRLLCYSHIKGAFVSRGLTPSRRHRVILPGMHPLNLKRCRRICATLLFSHARTFSALRAQSGPALILVRMDISAVRASMSQGSVYCFCPLSVWRNRISRVNADSVMIPRTMHMVPITTLRS